jgi:hypothetical protein
MSASVQAFNSGAVRPVECIRRGWDLIKDQYWLFFGISLVAVLIGAALPMAILMGPMMCGLYLTLFRRQRGEVVTFDMLFKGFDYFVNALIASLIQVLPMMVVLVPTYAIGFPLMIASMKPAQRGEPPDMLPFFGFIFLFVGAMMIMSIIIGVLFAFTFPLIVDRKLSAVDAIKTSIKAAMANLGGVLGLMILTMLLGFVGMLLCYVGALFVMPVNFAAWSIAYRQVFAGQDAPPAPPVF